MPLPTEHDGLVKYDVEKLFDFQDFIPAIGAPVLVSDRLGALIVDHSQAARLYPAVIVHRGEIVRADVKAVNVEWPLDCVDESASEFDYLELGAGTRVPYRFRRLALTHSKIPPSEGLFRVAYCSDLLVEHAFREAVEQAEIKGCSFFEFEGVFL